MQSQKITIQSLLDEFNNRYRLSLPCFCSIYWLWVPQFPSGVPKTSSHYYSSSALCIMVLNWFSSIVPRSADTSFLPTPFIYTIFVINFNGTVWINFKLKLYESLKLNNANFSHFSWINLVSNVKWVKFKFVHSNQICY